MGGGVLEPPHPTRFAARDRPRKTSAAVNRRAVNLEPRIMEFNPGEQVRKAGLGERMDVGLVYARHSTESSLFIQIKRPLRERCVTGVLFTQRLMDLSMPNGAYLGFVPSLEFATAKESGVTVGAPAPTNSTMPPFVVSYQTLPEGSIAMPSGSSAELDLKPVVEFTTPAVVSTKTVEAPLLLTQALFAPSIATLSEAVVAPVVKILLPTSLKFVPVTAMAATVPSLLVIQISPLPSIAVSSVA